MEGLLECHRVASERRAQGRDPWDHTIKVKHLLTHKDEPSNKDIQTLASGILNVLRPKFAGKLETEGADMSGSEFDMQLFDIVADLEEIVRLTKERGLDKTEAESLEAANHAIDALYDWADTARVWIT